jgi:hypothetical protein
MHQSVQRVPIKKRFSGVSFGQFETVLLVLTGLATVFFLWQAWHFLPVTADNMYPEAAGVFSASQWAHGLPLYQDFRKAPYLLTSFPPLWYTELGLAAKAGISNLDSLTFFGRILSLVSLLGIAVLAYGWNRRLGLYPKLALLAPTLYLSFPILIPWAVTARPDMPGLFFSFLAIYFAGMEEARQGTWFSAVAASVAFLTRHNSVAAPVAIVLWLAWQRKWKLAFVYCGVWAVLVGTTLTIYQVSSNGLLFLNLGGSKFGSLAFTYVRDVILRLLTSPESGFVIVLFALGAFAAIEARNYSDKRVVLVSIYLIASLFFAVLGSAAAGAAGNHFLEPVLAMAVLVPSGLFKLRETWDKNSAFPAFALSLVVVLMLPSLDMQRWNAMHRKPENMRDIVPLAENKRVFTDIPYLAARTSNPQLLDPASLTYAERTAGAWSSSELAKQLEQRQYDVVITAEPLGEPLDPAARYPRYPHLGMRVRRAISQNYQPCFEVSEVFVYFPLSSGAQSADSECALVGNNLPAGARLAAKPN